MKVFYDSNVLDSLKTCMYPITKKEEAENPEKSKE